MNCLRNRNLNGKTGIAHVLGGSWLGINLIIFLCLRKNVQKFIIKIEIMVRFNQNLVYK